MKGIEIGTKIRYLGFGGKIGEVSISRAGIGSLRIGDEGKVVKLHDASPEIFDDLTGEVLLAICAWATVDFKLKEGSIWRRAIREETRGETWEVIE